MSLRHLDSKAPFLRGYFIVSVPPHASPWFLELPAANRIAHGPLSLLDRVVDHRAQKVACIIDTVLEQIY